MNRTFDYSPRLDERNRAFRITSADPALLQRSRYWVPGQVVTNQYAEGACVGHGIVNEVMASPVRGISTTTTGLSRLGVFELANNTASEVYRAAQRIDEWEGESYDGTSVRAGMLVGRERGWWTGFRWAFNLLELRAALEQGPVVIGVTWTEGMYEAPGGDVDIRGEVVGGHCLVLTGYTPTRRSFANRPAFRWRNSWGGGPNGYGVNGSAYIRADDLDRVLFRAGGEAAVPVGRMA